MNIQIEGRHVKITESIQAHVHSKISTLEKYFNGVNKVHVILDVESTKEKSTLAEIVCTVPHGQPIVARANHADMYLAIDGAVHIAREHLKKFKERARDRKRNSGRLKGVTAEAVAESGADEDLE